MNFVELAFTVPAAAAEALAGALWEAGAQGLEERDETTLDKPSEGAVTLVVWIPQAGVEGFLGALKAAQPERLAEARVHRRDRAEDEWRDAWKQYFRVEHIGRFVIVPSWERYAAAAGELLLHLDPGRAFGTGRHASTRLCLEALSRLTPARRLLDVGCGSGILAIAAARAWPELAGLGLDLDPDAVEVSRENASRNGVAERLRFGTDLVETLTESYDLIVANIQPEVLIPMAPRLCDLLSSDGLLLLSGIVIEAAPAVLAAYAPLGLRPAGDGEITSEDGWRALLLRRGGSS